MTKTKQELIAENEASFPNNNSGFITPTILREFNADMINSLVDEIIYNEYTASITEESASFSQRITDLEELSGSNAFISASFTNNTLTFTQVDGDTTTVAGIASTGSNVFTAGQTISGSVTLTVGSALTFGDSSVIEDDGGSLRLAHPSEINLATERTITDGILESRLNTILGVNSSAKTQVTGSLGVSGSTSLNGTLTTTGNAKLGDAIADSHTITGSLGVSGSTSLNGTLTTTGNAKLGDAAADAHTITGSLGVSGSTNLNGALTTTGNAKLGDAVADSHTITGSLGVSGSATFRGNLVVTGSVNSTGNINTNNLSVYNSIDFRDSYARIELNPGGSDFIECEEDAYFNINTIQGLNLQAGNGVRVSNPATDEGKFYIGSTNELSIESSYPNLYVLNEAGGVIGIGHTIITEDTSILSNVQISGSVSNRVNTITVASNTASMDMGIGNSFVLTLPTGSTTHLRATNVRAGQTVNLLVKQAAAATGSLTLASTFKSPFGYPYTPTATGSAQDILTFVTFDSTTEIFNTAIRNLV
jgi:hypothetical protein